jgi:hypothetical protein
MDPFHRAVVGMVVRVIRKEDALYRDSQVHGYFEARRSGEGK